MVICKSFFKIQIMKRNADSMDYTLLGLDQTTIDDKLKKYSGIVNWNYIRPHFLAGNVIYVDSEMEIQKVGKAFSLDHKSQVKNWLRSGEILVPSEPHGKHWEKEKPDFLALIVTPFILIQPVD